MADDPMYHQGMRALQDVRDTRKLADRLEQVIVRSAFTDEDRAFIERSATPCSAGPRMPVPISQSAASAVWPSLYCLTSDPKTSEMDSLSAPDWPV